MPFKKESNATDEIVAIIEEKHKHKFFSDCFSEIIGVGCALIVFASAITIYTFINYCQNSSTNRKSCVDFISKISVEDLAKFFGIGMLIVSIFFVAKYLDEKRKL